MKRREFMAALAGLPVIGKYLQAKPKIVSRDDDAYIRSWIQANLDGAITAGYAEISRFDWSESAMVDYIRTGNLGDSVVHLSDSDPAPRYLRKGRTIEVIGFDKS